MPLPGPIHEYLFTWDDDSGELAGKDADEIKDWALLAKENGKILCDDINGDIPATDPLNNKVEFCALIGLDRLPESLKPYYPTCDYPGFVAYDDVGDTDAVTPEITVVYL